MRAALAVQFLKLYIKHYNFLTCPTKLNSYCSFLGSKWPTKLIIQTMPICIMIFSLQLFCFHSYLLIMHRVLLTTWCMWTVSTWNYTLKWQTILIWNLKIRNKMPSIKTDFNIFLTYVVYFAKWRINISSSRWQAA